MLRTASAAFVVLKALTPKDYKIREFNQVVWHRRYYDSNKLVAITCFTANSAEAYKIAKEFRKRGCKVIMGGAHVSFLPDEALAFCDSVVIGEAEGVWRQIIADYENGSLKSKYMGEAREDFYDDVHSELLNSPAEVIKDCVESTRGCKYRCYFCTIPALTQGKLRRKSVDRVVELLSKVRTRYRGVAFLDNNIYADPEQAKELFRAIKPLKIKWGGQCSIDIAQNEEVLQLAKDSGCAQLLIGYEISSSSSEQSMGGKFAMAKRYVELTKKIRKKKIGIKGHFIFGFDSDNYRTLWELWKTAFKINPTISALSLLTPFPGSQFFYDVFRDNRLINLNWSAYKTYGLVFKTRQMNPYLLHRIFPVIHLFFLLTTCRLGYLLLAYLAVEPWINKWIIASYYK